MNDLSLGFFTRKLTFDNSNMSRNYAYLHFCCRKVFFTCRKHLIHNTELHLRLSSEWRHTWEFPSRPKQTIHLCQTRTCNHILMNPICCKGRLKTVLLVGDDRELSTEKVDLEWRRTSWETVVIDWFFLTFERKIQSQQLLERRTGPQQATWTRTAQEIH